MGMENEAEPKWEGKVCAKVREARADQVWPLLEDFFNLHKWFPTLAICRGVEGVSGQPGCVRYCAGSSIPSNGSDNQPINWSTEKLLDIDPIKRSFTYQIVDGNIGFNSYVSTMKVLPGDQTDDQGGCSIEWSFIVDPVQGWRLENLISKFEYGLQCMAKRMEEALQTS